MPFGKNKCPSPEAKNGRHHWTKWRNERHPNTDNKHGPGVHVVFHCSLCGQIKK